MGFIPPIISRNINNHLKFFFQFSPKTLKLLFKSNLSSSKQEIKKDDKSSSAQNTSRATSLDQKTSILATEEFFEV